MVKLETWTGDGKYHDAGANFITFEACDDGNICCKRLLDKNLKKGAKDEFPMSEDFKQCWNGLKKKNLYMSTTSVDGWKAKEIVIHYYDQSSVACTLSWLQAEPRLKFERLPLICNHPGMKYFFEHSNTFPDFLFLVTPERPSDCDGIIIDGECRPRG